MATTASLAAEIAAELQPLIMRARHLKAHRTRHHAASTAHLHVIMMLEAEGPLTMSDLAEAIDVSLPSATGLVSRMEERGLVERLRDSADRRVVHVRLTDAGRSLTEEHELLQRQHVTRLLEAMTIDEQRTCLDAVRVLRAAIERLGAAADAESPCPFHPTTQENGTR
jgi:DNA-binding MarR family transcriptional regulator